MNMAAIDYTTIIFHNGKLKRNQYEWRDGDDPINLLPFEFNRLGRLDFTYADYMHLDTPYINENEKVFHLEDDKTHAELICYESDNYNVIYYISPDKDDTYVILGGYGHYLNPYTHFYERGLPDEVERMLMNECYEWLMEDVLNNIVDIITNYDFDTDRIVEEYHKIFNYKTYWDLSKEEQKEYRKFKPIEVEGRLFK